MSGKQSKRIRRLAAVEPRMSGYQYRKTKKEYSSLPIGKKTEFNREVDSILANRKEEV